MHFLRGKGSTLETKSARVVRGVGSFVLGLGLGLYFLNSPSLNERMTRDVSHLDPSPFGAAAPGGAGHSAPGAVEPAQQQEVARSELSSPAPGTAPGTVPGTVPGYVEDSSNVQLMAKKSSSSLVELARPGELSFARNDLKNFSFAPEKKYLEDHGLPQSKLYQKQFHLLKMHLVGTPNEKYRAVKECDARYKNPNLVEPPTESNLGCTYWRILKLSKIEKKDQFVVKKQKKRKLSPALAALKRKKIKTLADWNKLKGAPYQNAVSVVKMDKWPDAERLLKFAAVEPDNCETTSARTAMIRNLEDLLPNNDAWKAMNTVYGTLGKCLSPDNEAFEVVHLRMALLHLERGELNPAGTKLELSLKAHSAKEESRVLFWRGYLLALEHLDMGKIQKHDNPYWTILVEKYPLTLHALVVDETLGQHSFARVAGRPSPLVTQYVGNTWDKFNLSTFVYGLLIARKEKVAMERWGRYVTDNVNPVDFESALFVGKAHLEAGQTRSAIKTVFDGLRDFGASKLNPEVLEMLYPLRYEKEVVAYARGVDLSLVFSLMRQESSFNPKATSPVGAAGLMQVMPGTGKKLWKKGNLNLYDPAQNITVGSKYLANLLKSYNGNYVMTIASYNAGPRPVLRWKVRYNERIPLLFSDLVPYPETRNYVSGLMRNMHWYRALINETPDAAKTNREHAWTAAVLVPQADSFGIKPGTPPWRLAYENSRWLADNNSEMTP